MKTSGWGRQHHKMDEGFWVQWGFHQGHAPLFMVRIDTDPKSFRLGLKLLTWITGLDHVQQWDLASSLLLLLECVLLCLLRIQSYEVCLPVRSLSTMDPVVRSAFRSPFAMHHTIFVYHTSNHRLLPLPRVSSAFRSPFATYPAIRFVSHEASGCGCHIPWHAWATSSILRTLSGFRLHWLLC